MDDNKNVTAQATGPRRRNTAAADKRSHTVSVRLNAAELAWLDEQRGGYRRGEWLRRAAFGRRLPGGVPEINREAWSELSRLASNLNQLQRAINEGRASGVDLSELDALRDAVRRLRADLIGQGGDDESQRE